MSELAQRRPAPVTSLTEGGWTRQQIDLVKRTIVHGVGEATDDELALFEYVCRATGLSPFLGQIWAIRRKEQIDNAWQERMTIQTGIAGYRLIAERTGRYEGRLGPYWCGDDGQWRDVWLDAKPPAACKVGILKHGHREPLWAVATFAEFAQKTRSGELTKFWRTMPANQLAKCAMALACREAFPQETSNLYADAELPEVEESPNAGAVTTTPAPAPATTPSVPTLQQIKALRTVEDARSLVMIADDPYQQAVKDLASRSDAADETRTVEERWREFWWDAVLPLWKRVLTEALKTSPEGGPPPSGDPKPGPGKEGEAFPGPGDPVGGDAADGN